MAHGRHSYVAFYPSDWIAGTARMTRLQRSVYHDVCLEIWDKAQPCPYTALPLLLGDLPDWEQIVEQLVAAGKLTRTPAGLTNAKAMGVATKARDLWEKKSAGGRAGAEKAKGSRNGSAVPNRSTPDGTPNGTPDRTPSGTPDAEPQPEPEPEPEPERKESIERLPAVISLSPGVTPDIVPALTDACLKATGISVSPAKLAGQRNVVAGWLGEGIEARLIAETLQGAMARLPVGQSVSSLRYFDRHVRQAVKREEARENGHGREMSFAELAFARVRALDEGREPDDLEAFYGFFDTTPRPESKSDELTARAAARIAARRTKDT